MGEGGKVCQRSLPLAAVLPQKVGRRCNFNSGASTLLLPLRKGRLKLEVRNRETPTVAKAVLGSPLIRRRGRFKQKAKTMLLLESCGQTAHMLARSMYSKTQFLCRTNVILEAAVSRVPSIRIESVDRISNLGRRNINPFVVVVFSLPKLGLRLPQKRVPPPPPGLFCRLPWGFRFFPLSSIVWLSFSVFVSQGKCC